MIKLLKINQLDSYQCTKLDIRTISISVFAMNFSASIFDAIEILNQNLAPFNEWYTDIPQKENLPDSEKTRLQYLIN